MYMIGIPSLIAPSYYGPLWFARELFFIMASIAHVPMVKKTKVYILISVMVLLFFLPTSQMIRLIRYSIPFFFEGMVSGFNM